MSNDPSEYHRKTPLNTPVEMWAVNEKQDGRKLLCVAEMRVNGEVTASAEGLFISDKRTAKLPAAGLN